MALYLRKIDPRTHARLKIEAVRRGVSVDLLAVRFIKDGLRKPKGKGK